jgi:hypothetical protein
MCQYTTDNAALKGRLEIRSGGEARLVVEQVRDGEIDHRSLLHRQTSTPPSRACTQGVMSLMA